MIYIGIDIAKRSHVACAMREDNSLAIHPFEFSETSAGYEKLRSRLQSLECDPGEILIGMEATGMLPTSPTNQEITSIKWESLF